MATTEKSIAFESVEYETDMENKNYEKWVNQYPSEYKRFFGDLMRYAGSDMNEQDLQYFIDRGLNINELRKEYPSDSDTKRTPLHTACEYRLNNLIAPLLKLGADVNILDADEMSPLDLMLSGHGALDIENYEFCEQGIKLLIKNPQLKYEVADFILVDLCDMYKKKSEFLKEFLAKCQMRESDKLGSNSYSFEQYCQEYPLCFLDYSFIDRHYHLLTNKFKKIIRSNVRKFRPANYLAEKVTNSTCSGCPECIFGLCYNDLTDSQKSYIDNYTEFKSN